MPKMHHLLRNGLNNDDPEVPREILIFNPFANHSCKSTHAKMYRGGNLSADTRVN